MRTRSIDRIAALRHTRPSTLRDIQRDWERWTTGERIALAMIATSTFLLVMLIQWPGAS